MFQGNKPIKESSDHNDICNFQNSCAVYCDANKEVKECSQLLSFLTNTKITESKLISAYGFLTLYILVKL